jgi:hypothetical protein
MIKAPFETILRGATTEQRGREELKTAEMPKTSSPRMINFTSEFLVASPEANRSSHFEVVSPFSLKTPN